MRTGTRRTTRQGTISWSAFTPARDCIHVLLISTVHPSAEAPVQAASASRNHHGAPRTPLVVFVISLFLVPSLPARTLLRTGPAVESQQNSWDVHGPHDGGRRVVCRRNAPPWDQVSAHISTVESDTYGAFYSLVWQSGLYTMASYLTVSIVQGTGRLSCSDPNLQSLPNAGANHSATAGFHRCALTIMVSHSKETIRWLISETLLWLRMTKRCVCTAPAIAQPPALSVLPFRLQPLHSSHPVTATSCRFSCRRTTVRLRCESWPCYPAMKSSSRHSRASQSTRIRHRNACSQ